MDKGGLEYTIKVDNRSKAEFAAFDRDVDAAKQSFAAFKAELANTSGAVQGVSKATSALTRLGTPASTKKLQEASRNVNLLNNDLQRLGGQAQNLGGLAVAINAVKTSTRGINGSAAGFNKIIGSINQLNAINFASISGKLTTLSASLLRFNNVLGQVAPQIRQVANDIRAIGSGVGAAAASAARGLAQIQVANARAQNQLQVNAARAAGQLQLTAARTANGLQLIGARAQGLANNTREAVGQVERLIKAFVVVRAIRFTVDAFSGLVTTGIQFNSQLEQTELSMAAILSAAGRVRDIQSGKLLQGAEAFAGAQQVARQQMALLQKDALRTTATFEQLVDAFRQGTAPGLAAGLDPDQIRQVTVLIAQAATSVGVQGDKLAEEIRSVLGGAATVNTRVASVLGGPGALNKKVREAKSAGKLFETLVKDFGQFAKLGDAQAKTFEAAMQRVKESFTLVIASGALPFFESLKGLLNTITSQLVKIDVNGVTPKPEAIRAFRGISDGLASIANEARRVVDNLKAKDVFAIGELLAESFKLAGAVIGPVLEGIVRSFNDISAALLPVIQGFRQFLEDNREILVVLTRVLVIAKALSIAGFGQSLAIAAGNSKVLLANFRLFALQAAGLAGVFAAILIPLGAIQLVIAAATGTTLSLTQTVQALGLSFASLGKQFQIAIVNRIKDFEFLFENAGSLFTAFIGKFQSGFLKAQRDIYKTVFDLQAAFDLLDADELAEGMGVIAGFDKQITDLNSSLKPLGEAIDQALVAKQNEATKATGDLLIELAAIESQISELFQTADAQKNSLLFSTDFGAALKKLLDDIKASVSKGMAEGGKEGMDEIKNAVDAVDLSPSLADKIREAFKGVEDITVATFQATVDILESTVKQFSAFVADSIVDALDPSQDVSLVERFRQFLASILKLIIQTFTEIAIAKAILGIVGSVGGGGGALAGTSAAALAQADGGKVPRGRFLASSAHFGPQARALAVGGLAQGRPRGIPSSDTVPAWLTPNEYVVKAQSVGRVGLQFMEFINRGGLSRRMANELMGRRRHSITTPKFPTFATGGRVSAAAATQASPRQTGPIGAVIVSSPEAARKLYQGGRQGWLREFEADQASIKGRLGAR